MKYALLILLMTGASIVAMDPQEEHLTPTEECCYNWFVKAQEILPSTMLQLSSEDQDVFRKQIKVQDNPEEVTRSRRSFAEKFYTTAKQAKPPVERPFRKEFLIHTFLKITRMMHHGIKNPLNYTEVCIWSFNQLSKEEQMTFSDVVYLEAPEKTKKVADQLSSVICDKLIEIELLTLKKREAKKQELYAERLARFEKQYKNK